MPASSFPPEEDKMVVPARGERIDRTDHGAE
jgi:hypothetical protein